MAGMTKKQEKISERAALWQDPRLQVWATLFAFLLAGMTFLGFNRTPQQYLFMVGFSCVLDVALYYLFVTRDKILRPFSALVTGTGLSILTHFPHTLLLGAVPVFLAIASKYILTYQNKHVYNPGLFAIVMCLLFSDGMIAVAPTTQWGSATVFCLLIGFSALSIFLFNVPRHILTVSFFGFYFVQLLLRSYVTQDDIPADMLMMGVLQSPAFYLFTFFMLTDPKTSPDTAKGQVFMALWVVAADFVFHSMSMTFTLFYAGFSYFTARFLYLHIVQTGHDTPQRKRPFRKWREILTVFFLLWCGGRIYDRLLNTDAPDHVVDFQLTEMTELGLSGEEGDLLQNVDERIQHVAKWFYSMGDAVAVADVNQDGLQDIFLTQPLKRAEDRAALYLNTGQFGFDKWDIPELTALRQMPEKHGSPTQALFVDVDNDGDQDIVLSMFWGHPVLLQNMLAETGTLSFKDISKDAGLTDYMNSAAVNAADFNQDGLMDLVFAGSLPLYVSGKDYEPPRYFNIFSLPEPEYDGDNRMLNVMRRNPFNAKNASRNIIYYGMGHGVFEKQSNHALGLEDDTRWTLDIGTGDLNNDGWADLYYSNTAGPDRLYINKKGQGFAAVKGHLKDQVGQDTYRGMNASLADFDQNGFQDIYVSNMHKPELPEGSLLWMNDGRVSEHAAGAFRDMAFQRRVFNGNRFGWGAAVGDIDLDGDVDILQAAGWLDHRYDKTAGKCQDYVYKLFQIESAPEETHGYADNWPDMRGGCIYAEDSKRIFLNHKGYFDDQTMELGWNMPDNSRGIALADFDNDGDKDVIVTRMTAPVSVYKNDIKGHKNWIGLRLTGNGQSCNHDAVGSRISVPYQGRELVKYITVSNGLSAQSDARVVFPVEESQEMVDVTVTWCGKKRKTYHFKAEKYHDLVHNTDQ